MIDLVIASDDIHGVRGALLGDTEACAILYAAQTMRPDGRVKLLVREVQIAEPTDYTRKGPIEAELKPELVANVTKRAKRENYSLVFVHSHPGENAPQFSHTDDEGERHLAEFLARRGHNLTHAALVVSVGGCRARRLGTDEPIRVLSIGIGLDVLFDPSVKTTTITSQHDRQVRAFGPDGQKALERLRVGIVGLGGTGSIIAQQLVHLGVRDFVLIDPDVVEETNLNRLANATSDDIGKAKVDIAARYIEKTVSKVNTKRVKGNIIYARVARELLDTDLFFGCTDTHGSRAVLQQLSYQYMIPCIDMGVTITVAESLIKHIVGRVQMLAPGLSCLTCDGLLDPEQVRRDMLSESERRADPYIQGAVEPAPAVMSLNGTVSSIAVTILLSAVAGVPANARHVIYNALAPSLRSVRGAPKSDCYVCSRSGAFARGDAWPLLARQD
jgi:molybdopterin-synthase adenylyltransferase